MHTARGSEFESPEADVVESFVVEDHALISILDKLVHGQGRVVGLNYSV